MQATPGHLAAAAGGRLARVAAPEVLCGGEALPRPGRRAARAGRRRSGTCTARPRRRSGRLPRGGRRRARPVPIGRPIANTRVYVLDAHAAAGAGGRGGRAVHRRRRAGARLPRPARADGRALRRRPVRATPGARLYRTGDLARLPAGRRARVPGPDRPPGQDPRLPHRAGRDRGRARRGIRRVREAVVAARRRGAEDAGWSPTSSPASGRRRRRAARASCAERCPTTWSRRRSSTLDALPLTPNGKVDRKALPAPRRDRPERAASTWRRARRLERRLAEIWERAPGNPADRRRRITSSTSASSP